MAGDSPGGAERQESLGEATGKAADPRLPEPERRGARGAAPVALDGAGGPGGASGTNGDGTNGDRTGADRAGGGRTNGDAAERDARPRGSGRDRTGPAAGTGEPTRAERSSAPERPAARRTEAGRTEAGRTEAGRPPGAGRAAAGGRTTPAGPEPGADAAGADAGGPDGAGGRDADADARAAARTRVDAAGPDGKAAGNGKKAPGATGTGAKKATSPKAGKAGKSATVGGAAGPGGSGRAAEPAGSGTSSAGSGGPAAERATGDSTGSGAEAPAREGATAREGAAGAAGRAAGPAGASGPAARRPGPAGAPQKAAEPAAEPAAGGVGREPSAAAAAPAEPAGKQAPAAPLPPAAPASASAAPAAAPAAPAGAPVPPPPMPPPGRPSGAQQVPAYGPGRPTEPERTRQQPLPPAPEEPLKLLAALTNTPPPQQTFWRSGLRRVKIWTPLVVLLALVFVVVQSLRPLPGPTLALTAPASYTFGGAKPVMPWPSEGQAALEVRGLGSLGTFGAQKPEPIASVAKIMTAYLVLRDHPIKPGGTGATLTVDQQAAADYKLGAEGQSVVKVSAGQRISEFEALEDIMIASANNIARMLARWDAGSQPAFVRKMNAAAKSFGMDHTTYTDPSGLTATTVSTASDQLKLTGRVMADPVFRKVVAEPSYRTAGGDTYHNWNHLVGTNNVVGVKTGTSTAAGGNLVFAATKQVGGTTQLIIGVVLGQYKPSILDTVTAASLRLVLAGQQSLTSDRVIRKGDVVGYVDDGLGGHTPVVATRDVRAVGWPGVREPIALKAGRIPHSARSGTRVGTLTVGSGPGAERVPVALGSALTAPGFGAKLGNL